MDFVVLKVNGKDVSTASHEDTIAAFTTAKEPIIVEVLKRPLRLEQMGSEPVSLLCDTSTQTEWTGAVLDQPSTSFSTYSESFSQVSAAAQSPFTPGEAITNHYSTIAGDADDDDACDVEYEEVILRRDPPDAKLGLTLCYGSPEEQDTDIYINEVEPDSIAAKDGRIQVGDQLLQINGVDVRSREQAVSLFSEKRLDFILLLARPQMAVEDYFLDDEYGADYLDSNIILEHEEYGTTDTGTTERAHHEKDSGVGRTDDSTKNEESSDHEALDAYSILDGMGGRHCTPKLGSVPPTEDGFYGANSKMNANAKPYPGDISTRGMTLTPLCRFQSDASLDREMALLNKEMENIQLECETLVHRHMETQQANDSSGKVSECQLEHVYVNVADLQAAKNSQDPVLPLSKKDTVEHWVKNMYVSKTYTAIKNDQDTSSAYNTAESSGSGPLTLELTPVSNRYKDFHGSVMSLVSPRMEDKGTQLRDSDVASMFSCDSCRRCCKALVEQECGSAVSFHSKRSTGSTPKYSSHTGSSKSSQNKSHSLGHERDSSSDRKKEERNQNYVSFYPPPNTMYTNQANLQHTIWLQQQMLRQAMTQQKVSKSCGSIPWATGHLNGGQRGAGVAPKPVMLPVNRIQAPPPGPHMYSSYQSGSSPTKGGTLATVKEEEEMKMEWKVKRRADGTRYITRRPVRNRLLKARAMKILEERAGLTTDDDAVSELKTGRYWSKEERKRHLEKARDRKRKEMVIRSKLAGVKEPGEEGEDGKKEINILELSHKKMMKRRGKVVFDDFTTIQEVLAHGSKVTGSGSKPLGLLTVTTV